MHCQRRQWQVVRLLSTALLCIFHGQPDVAGGAKCRPMSCGLMSEIVDITGAGGNGN